MPSYDQATPFWRTCDFYLMLLFLDFLLRVKDLAFFDLKWMLGKILTWGGLRILGIEHLDWIFSIMRSRCPPSLGLSNLSYSLWVRRIQNLIARRPWREVFFSAFWYVPGDSPDETRWSWTVTPSGFCCCVHMKSIFVHVLFDYRKIERMMFVEKSKTNY